MAASKKITGRASSIPAGLAIASVVSLSVTIVFSALIGWLVEDEYLRWENVGYGIMVTLFTSAFLGSVTACTRIKRQRFMMCMLSGVIYFALLLSITALFFGGQYRAVGVTAVMVLAGSGCAVLLECREKGRGNSRKRKIRTC